jgi:L-rhamnose mutarotase
MQRKVVRYKVKPDQAEKNEALVQAVFEELHKVKPAGVRYATFKLEDGLTFVHLVSYETADSQESLTGLASFKKFIENIDDRYDEPAVTLDVEVVGAYNQLGA